MKERLVLWGALVCALVFVLACNLPSSSSSNALDTPVVVTSAAATVALLTASPAASAGTPAVQDCGEDMDCLIQAAKACKPATGRYVTQLDLFGALVHTALQFDIHGLNDQGQCAFDVATVEASVDYSEEARQQMRASGMSDEEIEAQRKMAEEQQLQAGPSGSCTGQGSDLAAMLQQWREGHFTMDDWTPFHCEGGTLANAGGEIVVTVEVTAQVPEATPSPTSPSAESDLVLPAPVVRFSHVTNSAVEGTKLYWFDLVNWQDFPPELFKITKGVPPCGQRPNRLWVIFRRADTMEEISHGCGARSPDELRTLELPLKESAGIPHRVVVDLWDRLTDKHYLSEPVTFP